MQGGERGSGGLDWDREEHSRKEKEVCRELVECCLKGHERKGR